MIPASFDLGRIGWDDAYERHLEEHHPGALPGRIVNEQRISYTALTAAGEVPVFVRGGDARTAALRSELPAVGDWVALEPVADRQLVAGILPRRSAFSRKVADRVTDEQIVAANIDTVFVVASLEKVSPRTIERYLTAVWQSGATPVLALTKADLCDDLELVVGTLDRVATDIEIVTLSVVTGEGIDLVTGHAAGGRTIAFLGPSGVGKSTLVNALLDEHVMETREIRSDGKGRHTTSTRRLLPLPAGGAVIDTPGMRELQLWEGDDALDSTFSDIAELANGCRFRDCAHDREPGCAVHSALDAGDLDSDRYASYLKQQRELAAIARKKDRRLAQEQTRRFKKVYGDARARSRPR